MIPLKLRTKYFTLEIFRRGIVFTVASIIFASGVNLVNGNIFFALISIFNKEIFNEDSHEYGFIVGLILILISLFLFYLIIINWRIEIYSRTFIQLRKCSDKFGTAINHRLQFANSKELRDLHTDAYNEYIKTVNFLSKNQTNIDTSIYEEASNINYNIGKRFIELDIYIRKLEKLENNDTTRNYDPILANQGLPTILKDLKKQMDDFANLIKEKEKFKILTRD